MCKVDMVMLGHFAFGSEYLGQQNSTVFLKKHTRDPLTPFLNFFFFFFLLLKALVLAS